MKKTLIIGLVIVAILVVVLVIALGGGGGGDDDETTVSGEDQVQVPITLNGASNVGSISIELTYDSVVLEAIEVKPGDLADNAMIEFNIGIPGWISIGIIDSSGVTGNGTVAVISFDVVDKEGTSALTFDEVLTHDATTLIDIINETSDGRFAAANNTVTAPVISFPD